MTEEKGTQSPVSRRQSIKEEEMAKETEVGPRGKEAPKKVSRREFVKGAAVGAAGIAAAGALASCAPAATPAATTAPVATATAVPAPECPPCPTPWIPEKWDEEADVVIVGGGGAGLAAAIEARDAGASVIVLEATSRCGGGLSVIYSFSETSLEKELGIDDSHELHYEDIMKEGRWKNDPELVRTFVESGPDCFEWMKSLGMEFLPRPIRMAGESVDRGHTVITISERLAPPEHVFDPWAKATHHRILEDAAVKRGTEILMETRGRELVADPISGRVMGVKAETKEKVIYCNAKRAVVLATGGFSANPKMALNYLGIPEGKYVRWSAAGNWGDGHKMAQMCGADTVDIEISKVTIPTVNPFNYNFTIYFYAGGILVNKNVKRFCDESQMLSVISDKVIEQPDCTCFQIFDKSIAKRCNEESGGRTHWEESPPGELSIGDTIPELATKLGLDPEALTETVNKYNSYVEAGEDPEFGRTTRMSPMGELVKIDSPPFIGCPALVGLVVTTGGITQDTRAQVTNVYGEIIPGLYAAGELCGGRHGHVYVCGNAAAGALIFGRIAGKNAAAEEAWV